MPRPAVADAHEADAHRPVSPAGAATAATAEDAVRALAIKGYAGPAALATALGTDEAASTDLLNGLLADGLAEPGAGSFRLTAGGKEHGRALLGADAAAWRVDRALAALDAFLDLDRRMKDIVTAWQTREVDGAQALNDHADAAYDAAILDRLAGLHADVSAWLAGLDGAPARMARYGERLAAALAAATGGDGRFVASPRVDSYHGVWFELHEDLILLAGRSRADEVAAGRA